MRCLSIADAAFPSNEECSFISATGDFAKMIASRGYKQYELGTDYSNLDTEEIIPVLDEIKPNTVIVDSFSVTFEYLENLHRYCKKRNIYLVYIDDTLVFPYPCDMLINYHIFASESSYAELYKGKTKPRFLLNTDYVPLRKEFQGIEKRIRNGTINHILVSTGGADPEHITIEVMKNAIQHSDLTFHIVVGGLNKDRYEICEFAQKYSNIVIHENAIMSELMLMCDLAISAAGATLYELCVTQTPTITFVSSDNQVPIAEGFSRKKLMKNCGDVRVLGRKNIAKKLVDSVVELKNRGDVISNNSKRIGEVVDGYGSDRIVQEIINRK